MRSFFFLILFSLPGLTSCFYLAEDPDIVDLGDDIEFVFDEGLNDDPRFRLSRNADGLYYMVLTRESQNIQRISGRLLRDNKPVYSSWSGYTHTVKWDSNLHWWIPLPDGTLEKVPVVNSTSKSDPETGRVNTVIAPIGAMRGDTLKLVVSYEHYVTRKRPNSSYFQIEGTKLYKYLIRIVLV